MIGMHGFEGRKPIKIIHFLNDFRIYCNNTDVYEDTAVCMLPYFLSRGTKRSYQAQLDSPEDERRHRHMKGLKIITYLGAVYYLLSTYATTNVVNKTKNAVSRMHQHHFADQKYANELAERAQVRVHLRRQRENGDLRRTAERGDLSERPAFSVNASIDMQTSTGIPCSIDQNNR